MQLGNWNVRLFLARLFLMSAILDLPACGPDEHCGNLFSAGDIWYADAVSSKGGTQVELRWQPTKGALRLERSTVNAEGVETGVKRFGRVRGRSFIDATAQPDTNYFYRFTSMNPGGSASRPCAVTVGMQQVFTASQASWSGNASGEVHPLMAEGNLWLFDRGERLRLVSASDGAPRWSQKWLDLNWLVGKTGAPVYIPEKKAIAALEITENDPAHEKDKTSLYFFDIESGKTIAQVPRLLPPATAPITFDDGSGGTAIALVGVRGEFDLSEVSVVANDGSPRSSTNLLLRLTWQSYSPYHLPTLTIPPVVVSTPAGQRLLLSGRRTLLQDALPVLSAVNAKGEADWTAGGSYTDFVHAGGELFAVNTTSITVIDATLGSKIRTMQYLPYPIPEEIQVHLSQESGGHHSLVVSAANWSRHANPFSTAVVDPITLAMRWTAPIGAVLGLGDTNQDGIDDLISLSHDRTFIAAFDGVTGAERWRYSLMGSRENLGVQEIKVMRLGPDSLPWLAVLEVHQNGRVARLTLVNAKGSAVTEFWVPIHDLYHYSWRDSNQPQARISALPPDHVLYQIERSIYVVPVR